MCSKWRPRRWRHTCIRRAKLSMTRTHSSLVIFLIFAVIAPFSTPLFLLFTCPVIAASSTPLCLLFTCPVIAAFSTPLFLLFTCPVIAAFSTPLFLLFTRPVIAAFSTPLFLLLTCPDSRKCSLYYYFKVLCFKWSDVRNFSTSDNKFSIFINWKNIMK